MKNNMSQKHTRYNEKYEHYVMIICIQHSSGNNFFLRHIHKYNVIFIYQIGPKMQKANTDKFVPVEALNGTMTGDVTRWVLFAANILS